MTAGTLADLLRGEGLTHAQAEAPDATAPHRTQSVPTIAAGRDKVGTLEANSGAVSRLSRLSRPEKTEVDGETRAQASLAGAGEAGAAGYPFARDLEADRLRKAAEAEGLDPLRVLALDDAKPGDLLALPDDVLRGYALALICESEREAGRVPEGWTVVVECKGCGPVRLWPGLPREVEACPWCWTRRRVGRGG